MKYYQFNRRNFFLSLFSMLTPINNMMSNIEGVGGIRGVKKKTLLRKIFTLMVDSPCSSPLVAMHLYVPSFSFPALYSVRTDDDSSLRVTVMSGLFGSILSPLGPNHSIFLATPTTERTSENSVSKNEASDIQRFQPLHHRSCVARLRAGDSWLRLRANL